MPIFDRKELIISVQLPITPCCFNSPTKALLISSAGTVANLCCFLFRLEREATRTKRLPPAAVLYGRGCGTAWDDCGSGTQTYNQLPFSNIPNFNNWWAIEPTLTALYCSPGLFFPVFCWIISVYLPRPIWYHCQRFVTLAPLCSIEYDTRLLSQFTNHNLLLLAVPALWVVVIR
jgi:hypothetical protein